MKLQSYLDNFVLRAEMPGEPVPGQSIAEIFGDGRVLIEKHKGIISYGSDNIAVRVSYGVFSVFGSCLTVALMSSQQLVITGKITGVTLKGGKC